ncbi:EcoAI/FtnUII family type I restriction enzme subunit R [Mesorhizobium sp.]|uniref:EcoAI/FtnUII family type I restriction enzme subunit R n=1 Tax=Mesorhizobium sp. TaxID=1871066 RepID=UPI000FE9C0AF|nr:DEAD/DEAH box helicase family protein [Mesorhizobium sp.]RWK44775.1 MAG: restriction endonuclease [Mesorhizobium sp.]TIP39609.1 MAG: restriction endonuclease [Mesorhizobium sp.]TIQ13028.1 MAG: restriction endonuclease [Mesorhizobium sp.]
MSLSERDICTKLITPAVIAAGWDLNTQLREEVTLTDGRVIVRGKLSTRGRQLRADYVLYHRPNVPLAVIEAKDATHSTAAGIQQALSYAEMLDVPFVFSSNGSRFVFHDKTATTGQLEREIEMDDFPTPAVLWAKYQTWKGLDSEASRLVEQNYHAAADGRSPRYYQATAVNRAVAAVANGQNRILLVMATGTGKTYTAFQIIWRLWKARAKKRILFLADRNILVDQTKGNDFTPFGGAMTKVTNRQVDKSYEIYLALYQAVSGTSDEQNIYKQFSPDFFDLIIIDECHRGSAAEDSGWREILTYYSSATQIGMTATPKETAEVSNTDYFGEPIYTYSLRQGIEDGFLAPYKVIRYDLDLDLTGYRPQAGTIDRFGHEVEDRIYGQSDVDTKVVFDPRTKLVADKITEFLKGNDRFGKTIVFCEDTEHADRMRKELANANPDLVADNHRYVVRMTGDDPSGAAELDNFIDPFSTYPVIATTSKLLTTGVDVKTCKLIVLDQRIQSMTEFKQIIGRGTRIDEEHGKRFFTIMDFKRATELFADPAFDGDPVQIFEPEIGSDLEELEAEFDGGDPAEDTAEQLDSSLQPRKYYIDGVEVEVLARRVQYLDAEGKLITEALSAYVKRKLQDKYLTLGNFLARWSEAERKQAVLNEVEELGIPLEALREEAPNGARYDTFDLVCHIAFDRPLLTRRERAARVRDRSPFAAYGESARAVLYALLDKYADDDGVALESGKILHLKPFDQIGTPVEIIRRVFGGKDQYQAAVRELESQIYAEA